MMAGALKEIEALENRVSMKPSGVDETGAHGHGVPADVAIPTEGLL
jgi:alanine dehydrogenase